ncbi:MAG TPA: fatty acid desaturase [Pyrinomonadaceae bacterium]|nr:fatty acid desaturase [Pyrinomonadaceae bacterium]
MIAQRRQIFHLSRALICVICALSIGSLLVPIANKFHLALDILLRTYLIFLGTVMAHESVHGHLGSTRRANFWWGRIALLPSMVPFTNFRRTHQLHHAYTNIPDKDPDHFMKSRNLLELSLRAIAMPHHWFFWLRKRGRLKRADLWELFLNYLAIVALYATVLSFVGPTRLLWGMAPPLILVSLLLWYPFAVQTHEGFSTGSAEARSHDYYGNFMYWFSLGLSMHRQHHLQPNLSWIELRRYVQPAPRRRWWWPQRDIRIDVQQSSDAV